MKTPICDFVDNYIDRQTLRLHMPGHKGRGEIERRDITEIEGADLLYHAEGIIKESQENAAALFGTGKTLYSCEGSSLSIRAMVYLARLWAEETGRKPKILAGRNAHKTFLSAVALMDVEVEWIFGENLLTCVVTPQAVESCLQGEYPAAVYVTSPDYLGVQTDVAALAEYCRKKDILLLVDNAHGAYLQFLPQSEHPIALGAHLCCDSAHKTLPVLTGGAYLQISADAPALVMQQAENAMALFASTSPSYLILQSLDRANAYLAAGYREKLTAFLPQVQQLRHRLQERGWTLVGSEPLKLTLAPKSRGYTGEELARCLEQRGITVEFADADHTVLMLSPELPLDALEQALTTLPRQTAIPMQPPVMHRPKRACSPRQALLRPSIELPVRECVGKVTGALTVSCPPAVPVVVCGEVIDATAVETMEYYGIKKCFVIK